LKDKGIDFITTVRRKMKIKVMSWLDRAMLSRKFIIKAINAKFNNGISNRAFSSP